MEDADRPGVWGGLVSDAYTFDAVVLGDRECDAWVHYYRHDEWAPFLRDSVGLVSAGFGKGPRRTLVGAWLVLPAIDPVEAARRGRLAADPPGAPA